MPLMRDTPWAVRSIQEAHLDGKVPKLAVLVLHHELGAPQLVQVHLQGLLRDPVLLDLGGVLVDGVGQLLWGRASVVTVVPSHSMDVIQMCTHIDAFLVPGLLNHIVPAHGSRQYPGA